MNKEEDLNELYQDPRIGMTSKVRFFENLKKLGYKYTLKDVENL
jgi:hypothetical protein